MMPNQELRVIPVMDKLSLCGKRLLGLWYRLYFSVKRSGIKYLAYNDQDPSLLFKIFSRIKQVARVARKQSRLEDCFKDILT